MKTKPKMVLRYKGEHALQVGNKVVRRYLVERVENSLEHNPGTVLDEGVVSQLLRTGRWNLSILGEKG